MRTTVLVALASLAPTAAVAYGQQPDTARIAPVVVTATRIPVAAADAPATVSVITGEQLRRAGITSVADALATVPGVTIAQSGSFGSNTSLFVRGGESKYVKVLIDGVPVNDPGGAIDLGALTTDNVDRIEVVRGPASVLYGADAVTGVIQIFTRRGAGAPRAIVSARGGSYGSSDEDATLLGGLGSGDFSIALARHDTRGIYAFNNGNHNTVASGAVHLLLDEHTDLHVALRYGDDAFHYPTDGGGTVVDSNAFQSRDRTTLSADLGRVFTSWLDAHLALTSEGASGGTNDQPDTPASSGTQSLDRTRRRGAELRTNVELPIATVLTAGAQVEQEDERTETQSVFDGSEFTSVFEASRRNQALYAQTLTTLSDSIVLTAGARLDDNERFGRFGTYRAAGSWRALRGLHVRASLGTAFREPSFFENYATGFVTGNPNLSPERSVSWEVGARQTLLGNRVMLGVVQFGERFRNMIDFTGSTDACGASYCNVARANAAGREFEAQLDVTSHLAFSGNLTHLQTRVVQAGFDTTSGGLYHAGEALIRRPTTGWNLAGTYAARGASLDVRMTHVGRRSDRDFRPFPATPVTDPAYTRTDLGAVLPIALLIPDAPHAELTLHVENLFDVRYQSVFNFLTPRRVVEAGARIEF
jgi:vitamin B12 transporter